MADLLAVLARLTGALDQAGIRYALAGGMALAVRARPRATVDLDLMIATQPDQIAALRAACESIGLAQTKRRVTQFRRVQLLRMLAVDGADPIAIDFLLVPGALEEPAMRRATEIALGGRSIRVVSAEDLVLLKLLRDSDQDRVDIRAIAETNRLDRRYLDRMAAVLRVLTPMRRTLG